ncbi:MAG: hypothetical protein L3J22_10920 [Xanthomonadales bacterium]|nr:hypothetical protein [Xanthomonadales bacterium]
MKYRSGNYNVWCQYSVLLAIFFSPLANANGYGYMVASLHLFALIPAAIISVIVGVVGARRSPPEYTARSFILIVTFFIAEVFVINGLILFDISGIGILMILIANIVAMYLIHGIAYLVTRSLIKVLNKTSKDIY